LEDHNSFQDLLIHVVEQTTQAPGSPVSAQELTRLTETINMEMTVKLFDAVGGDNEAPRTARTAGRWIDLIPLARPEGRSAPYDQDRAYENEEQPPTQPPTTIDRIVTHASESYGVDSALIKAVIRAESDFDPHATSDKGAIGLMQLMPETAEELGVADPYDPAENIMAGTRYLKTLLDRYQGNIPLALAGYNWGMGNVERHPERMPPETRTYIARVNDYYREETS
jgi:soluble lytic murein transglycosylase-like protein